MFCRVQFVIFLVQFLVILAALMLAVLLARPEVPFLAEVLVPLHVSSRSADAHHIRMAVAIDVGDDDP